ncbi:MAG: hypothetical protein ACQKBY_08340, partial [Verrucomicrobiales bacterium]
RRTAATSPPSKSLARHHFRLWLFTRIDEWQNSPLKQRYYYRQLDEIWLKPRWGDGETVVRILVAVSVSEEGVGKVVGVIEEGYSSVEGKTK